MRSTSLRACRGTRIGSVGRRLARAGSAAYLDAATPRSYDHKEPRLTRMDELYCETAKVSILQRVWGYGPDLLARHGRRLQNGADPGPGPARIGPHWGGPRGASPRRVTFPLRVSARVASWSGNPGQCGRAWAAAPKEMEDAGGTKRTPSVRGA